MSEEGRKRGGEGCRVRGEERRGGVGERERETAQQETLFLKIENFIRIAMRGRREEGVGGGALQK